jgi:hypothetical protein
MKFSIVTSKEIYDLLIEIRALLNEKNSSSVENGLKEYSLYKISKILGKSQQSILRLVEEGRLKAIVEKSNYTKNGRTFRFTARAIKEYQNSRNYAPTNGRSKYLESPQQIANRLIKEFEK